MLNLYEILEVSQKASKEVIEKAYRVLAKKYHPDLQPLEEKQNAERKMKQINEAYEILSDDEKRKEYDITLLKEEQHINKEVDETIQYEKEEKPINKEVKKTIQYEREDYKEYEQQLKKQQHEYQNMQNEMNRIYAQAYNNYLRSLRI